MKTRNDKGAFVPIAIFCLILPIARCAKGTAPGAAAGRAELAADPPATATIVIRPDSPLLKQIGVEPVGTAQVPKDEVVAPGRIELDSNRVSRVLLPVPGRIDHVLVRLGDPVLAGQPMFTIDSPEADAILSEFRQCQAAVSLAQSTLAKAKADFDRTMELYEHKAAAKKEVLAAENELAQARAGQDQANAACEHAHRKLEILGLAGEPGRQNVTVRSPLAGKVIDLSVTAGEYRNDTTTPVITVADLSTVWVTSAVSENSIRLIDVGEAIQVELVAYPGEVFEARVKRIADMLDPKTRTVQVRAELANPLGKFRPEMFGRIHHSHVMQTLPVVPARAILRRGTDAILYVERSRGIFEKVAVLVGPARGDQIPVLAGIKAGDRVAVDGVMLLAGTEVR